MHYQLPSTHSSPNPRRLASGLICTIATDLLPNFLIFNHRIAFRKLASLIRCLLLFLIASVRPSLASLAAFCASLSLVSWALGVAAGKSMLCWSKGILGAAKAREGLLFRALRSAFAAIRRCFLDFAVGAISKTISSIDSRESFSDAQFCWRHNTHAEALQQRVATNHIDRPPWPLPSRSLFDYPIIPTASPDTHGLPSQWARPCL